MGLGAIGIILVVDDEQPVLDFVAKKLRDSGYDVATASSGEEAVAMVEQQNVKPHFLVADLVLPAMSGFALADTLRKANPNMKTLFISGYTGAEYFRQMKVSTADIPFLQKPFTADALLNKVQELATTSAPGK
jgi:CheY-like chemotaxis protein